MCLLLMVIFSVDSVKTYDLCHIFWIIFGLVKFPYLVMNDRIFQKVCASRWNAKQCFSS